MQRSPVVEQLDEGDEEDDGRNDTREEPWQARDRVIGEEDDAVVGEMQQLCGRMLAATRQLITAMRSFTLRKVRDEGENVIASSGAKHEEGDYELDQHAHYDSVPLDRFPVLGRGPENEQEHDQAEQTHGAVGARVVRRLLAGKRTSDDDSDGQERTGWDSQPLGDERGKAHACVVPNKVHGLGDDGDGCVEEEQAQGDGEPQQERDDPVLVMAVQHQTRDPPAFRVGHQLWPDIRFVDCFCRMLTWSSRARMPGGRRSCIASRSPTTCGFEGLPLPNFLLFAQD